MLTALLCVVIAAEPDKSLGPDGEPWSAESMTAYLHDKISRLEKFTLAKSLELEVGPAKRKKKTTVSETAARKRLLESIERKHKMTTSPGRGILVFNDRHNYFDNPPPDDGWSHLLNEPATKLAADRKAQALYWTSAVELVDFHGDEEAAAEYAKLFAALPGNDDLGCRRWYAIVVTGSKSKLRSLEAVLWGRPGDGGAPGYGGYSTPGGSN